MSFAALCVAIACLALLTGNALAYLSSLLARAPRGASGGRSPDALVEVLVPARDEGEGAARCVRSLLAQGHARLKVRLLVEDERDSSARALEGIDDPRLAVWTLGRAGKADKLNAALPRTEAPFIAILDADHEAEPRWLEASLAALAADPALVAVQGERRALSLSRLPSLWDSAQNHVGNEWLDRARAAWGLPIFFTGTTAVFRREALAGGFGESVTEDTELSLRLILSGARIGRVFGVGSRESVAPDLRSYSRRRRRWASGHTTTFLASLGPLLRGARGRARAALLLHGAFYLVPLVVLVLLWAVSLHLVAQLRPELAALVALASLLSGALFCRALTGGLRVRDVGACALWTAPQLAMLAPMLLRRWGDEHAYFLVSFPYARELTPLNLILALVPLVFVLVAALRLRRLDPGRVLLLTLSYPLMLLCDLASISLGLVDAAVGARAWPRIEREARARVHPAWFAAGAGVLALGAALVHDVDARARCAPAEAWLLRSGPTLALDLRTRRAGDEIELVAQAALEGVEGAELRAWIEGAPEDARWSPARQRRLRAPLGWETRRLIVEARGPDVVCRAARAFSTTVTEIDGGRLTVNGEPFLLKGVIPTFQTARVGLDDDEGLALLHALGANTARLYHAAHPSIARAAAAAGLALVDQPDESTWENVDVAAPGAAERLAGELVGLDHRPLPNVLFHLLGNELEIRGGERAEAVARAIERARDALGDRPFSYSTYYLFLDYAPPLLGINMLDSGDTYWRGGLDLIRARRRPFFASELGGFVAFTERPPPPLAAYRLHEQWRALAAVGGNGAIIFQSHDNWAQPVPSGLNDPFAREHPDDTRGLFTVEGTPGPRVDVVREIFADLELDPASRWLTADATTARATLRNVRPYALEAVRLRWPDGSVALALDRLAPGERREVELRLPTGAPDELRARFTSHRGLPGEAAVFTGWLRPDEARARVVARGFARDGGSSTRGWLLRGGEVDLVVPRAWSGAEVRGRRFAPGRHRLPLPPAVRAVEAERVEPGAFSPLRAISTPGPLMFRARAPIPEDPAWLLLDGLGAARLEVAASGRGPWREVGAHPYRELALPAAELPRDEAGWTWFRVVRGEVPFVAARHHPRGQQVDVVLSPPRLFAPPYVALRQLPQEAEK